MNREQFKYLFETYKPDQHSEELFWLIKKIEEINTTKFHMGNERIKQ